MLDTISGAELNEEWAYYKCNPYGEWRDDLRVAMQSNLIANIHSKQKYTYEDFMPKFSKANVNTAKLLRAQFAHLVKRAE